MYKRMCVRDCRYVTGLTVVAVILALCSLMNAETAAFAPAKNVTVAGPDRPADVPQGYVITPFGYFHPSCVMELAQGNTLLDKTVQHADGTVEAAPVCNYAHYTASGAVIFPDSRAVNKTELPTINGWLESVNTTTTTSYGAIEAGWIVPPLPKVDVGQTLFFFPGFEDIDDVQSIVQPVLQWYAPGPWAMASWNCCMQGTTWESTPINVSPGDTVLGGIVPNCKPGGNYCATWDVVSEDRNTGQKTTLAKTPAAGQTWNWAFGAVTEDYSVQTCDDFPANTQVTFLVHLYDQNRKLIANPGWTGSPAGPGVQPQCNYGLKVTPTKETVEY
jgi:hypothetical protein